MAAAGDSLMLLHLTVDGRIRAIEIDANTSLLWAVRELLGLTDTRYGCGFAAGGIFRSVRPAIRAETNVRGSR